ncbi:MAG: hypothetical protein WCJ19_05145 [bacterium]
MIDLLSTINYLDIFSRFYDDKPLVIYKIYSSSDEFLPSQK